MVLQKREKPLSAEGQQLDLWQAEAGPDEADEDYQVYMARIDNIGYDATGRYTVPEDEAANPPEVKEVIADFTKRLGW